MFNKNMHIIDRSIRVFFGLGLIYFGFIDSGWVTNSFVQLLLAIMGTANLLVAATGFCPLYVLANFDFAQVDHED
jgi:hypothetical protein